MPQYLSMLAHHFGYFNILLDVKVCFLHLLAGNFILVSTKPGIL
jgi:hypothetical protein